MKKKKKQKERIAMKEKQKSLMLENSFLCSQMIEFWEDVDWVHSLRLSEADIENEEEGQVVRWMQGTKQGNSVRISME